jgi:hypothetical protein
VLVGRDLAQNAPHDLAGAGLRQARRPLQQVGSGNWADLGREIRMVIDSTDPFAAAKPDARLIKLLLRARRFNATLAEGEGVPFAALAQREGQPVLFHSTRPPQLSCAGSYPNHPRGAATARFDGREAPRALTSAACLARSEGHARLCLSPIRIQRSTARSGPEKTRFRWGRHGILADHRHRRCGTGIWPDRDIAAGWARYRNTLRVSADPVAKPTAHTRAESRGSRPSKADAGERRTLRWRRQS